MFKNNDSQLVRHKERTQKLMDMEIIEGEAEIWDIGVDIDLEEVRPINNRVGGCENTVGYLDTVDETIRGAKGDIHVAIQGDRNSKNPVIVTLHDIGQNHVTCFQSFFSFNQFKPLLDRFTVYHLNFPGQHETATELPEDYAYPTMDEMSDLIQEVFTHYNLKSCILFGVGAGANIFLRLALKNPKLVDCMILANCNAGQSSWTEWSYEKMTSHYLKTKGMTAFCQEYLMWHYFGYLNEKTNYELLEVVKDQLNSVQNPRNLAFLLDSYAKRSAIKIERPQEKPGITKQSHALKCGVLQLCGWDSPAIDATVDLHACLDPEKSDYIKISDATSMVLDEQPNLVTQAIVLFLQGYGYALKLKAPTLVQTSSDPAELMIAAPVC